MIPRGGEASPGLPPAGAKPEGPRGLVPQGPTAQEGTRKAQGQNALCLRRQERVIPGDSQAIIAEAQEGTRRDKMTDAHVPNSTGTSVDHPKLIPDTNHSRTCQNHLKSIPKPSQIILK